MRRDRADRCPKVRSLRDLATGGQPTGDSQMKKLLQAAGVAGLVLFGAVGCSTCCGSKTTTAASPCANGQCATAPATSGQMMTSGMSAQPMPTTMTVAPGRSPMMPVTSMPAGGAPMPTGGSPVLLPQN